MKTMPANIFSSVGCLLTMLTCAPAMASDAQRLQYEISAMPNLLNKAAQLLNLPEPEFFAFDDDRQTQMQHALAQIADDTASPDATLLALGAPAHVNMELPKVSIPLLIGSVYSGLRAWQVNFNTNLHVFAHNLSEGTLFAIDPFTTARRGTAQPRSGVGSPPNTIEAQARYTEVSLIDLLAKPETRLTPGKYIVTAIADDLQSNSVPIQLTGKISSSSAIRPESQVYLRHKLVAQADLPNRVEVPATVQKNAPIFIRVAIRVGMNDGILEDEARSPIWPCHIILIKLDASPVVIPAWVPVQAIGESNSSTEFNAVFQVDVRAASSSPLHGQYRVYVDVGRALLGPYSFVAEN